ncbi:MAG: hypothetical protein HYS65_02580 [Betaproteobacteria bacterium]|nr:hypothetical protein [Betaproteobacteria bacterium]MBI2225569.1 hypothetical protein [Betaproteobacteria bacterium]MBI2294230.1 hypothetical protein [Betaproteobacteria bacterium]MBI3055865.1 hypothetical protein [Betaproteobacteria bacterium]
MHNSRLLMLLAASSLAAGSIALQAQAQSATPDASPQARLRPPASVDYDTSRTRLTPGAFGLKPQSARSKEDIALPFSLNYNREIRSIIMPLDEKNTWDVGVMFNVNTAPGLEPATSPALGLQPKRTPGIMLQKKF